MSFSAHFRGERSCKPAPEQNRKAGQASYSQHRYV